ncbi:MAG: stage III sporulation protein SpoAB [Clostridium lundense]|nr:stage III sporulation protein SpoAB [Clostridium thermopalmarium]MBE6078967.1 stage III sporulation protein SpoAB [Clostridium lundense]
MYLKIVGCTLILICSSLIGFLYGESLKKRVFQLKEIEQALLELKSKIVYTNESLPKAFQDIGYKCNKPIGDIFVEVSNLLYNNEVDSVNEGFKRMFKQNRDKLNLKQSDIDIMLNLSKSLGESDVEGQKSILLLTLENVKKQVYDAEIEMNKNIKMYRYLGFSFGAILTIMII